MNNIIKNITKEIRVHHLKRTFKAYLCENKYKHKIIHAIITEIKNNKLGN
jgi:hypothetical protein